MEKKQLEFAAALWKMLHGVLTWDSPVALMEHNSCLFQIEIFEETAQPNLLPKKGSM
jgi:hypothetical protein